MRRKVSATWQFQQTGRCDSMMFSSKRFTGKTSGAGNPPPNEMISGYWVTFSSSRMAELLMPNVRCA
ncbi:MAG TPA: hypothetical protein VFE61_20450 [Candidatus Sulfotelmatobacter sp.]|nr:hypothetical protein [Candidatus Sulfotelmatobacter sp.]